MVLNWRARSSLIRLLAATRSGDADFVRAARETVRPRAKPGVAAYLTKPVRQSQLFDCLTTVVSQPSVNAGELRLPETRIAS